MAEAAGLHYELHGPPDAPPVILSSGLGGSAGYWAPNLPALARNFRVIAYDHRGTGRSDRVIPVNTCVADMAADLLSLLDAEGIERAHVIGHALGGMIGIEAALSAPGRIGKLVLVNGWAQLSPHTARCFDARLALLHGSGPEAFLAAQPLFLYPPDWIAAHDEALQAEAAHHLAAFAGIETTAARIAAVRAFSPSADDLAALGETLVIATRDDFLVPYASALALAEAIPSADVATFDWGGHACNVTDPASFERIVIDFLKD